MGLESPAGAAAPRAARPPPGPPGGAGHDLPALPLEVFDRLVRPGEHVDRVLDRDRAETLQPAPHLDPEVVGFGRDLVDEQYPAGRSGLRHVDVTSQTNLLTITSVSCENFPSKTSLDRDHLTGGDMGQRISAVAALLLIIPARQQAQQPLAPVDWKQGDAGLGKAGALQPDGAHKVGMPRSDLHVTIGGVAGGGPAGAPRRGVVLPEER